MIDLHVHSTCSDGSVSPTDIVRAAADIGLTAVALTDHDTVAGVDEFMEAAPAAKITAVPGVEISCSWYAGTMHMVGLFVDPRNADLLAMLETIQGNRHTRNLLIIEKLRSLGIDITHDEAAAVAGGDVVGRPHIAQVLVRRGACCDLQDAFDRFLATGKPAYVRRFLPLPEEAIGTLHKAGAVVVWAHPLSQLRTATAKLRQTARFLKDAGLDAMEVHYPGFSEDETATASAVAKQTGLLASGGSDFHGENSPGIALGTGRGDLRVPDHLLPPLAERAKTYRK